MEGTNIRKKTVFVAVGLASLEPALRTQIYDYRLTVTLPRAFKRHNLNRIKFDLLDNLLSIDAVNPNGSKVVKVPCLV
jgi:hypothetical protein